MKMKTRLASLFITAGFLICNYQTTVNATTLKEDTSEDTIEERIVDEQYEYDYYEYPMGFDQREDAFYIRNSYSSTIEWEVEPADEQIWTNTEVYGRYIPNMNIRTGVFLDYGTEVHLIGYSPNGWDVIEYDGLRYLLWHEYWSAEEPPKRASKAVHSSGGSYSVASGGDASAETYVESSSDGSMTYMGTWCISAYEWTGNTCANGNYPTEWYTCAFNSAPRGATIYIEGLGYFVNEDYCGTPSRLDIYLGDPGACIQFGLQYHDVYIVN